MAEAAVETQVQTPEDDGLYKLLSGTQKCAILMLLLGEDEAAEILKNLSPREVQQLGSAMYSVADVDQKTVNLVLESFWRSSKHRPALVFRPTAIFVVRSSKRLGKTRPVRS